MTPPSASRLVTLTAIVVALAAAVGITGGTRGIVERPLVAPGLDPADVTGIEITHEGAPPIVIAVDDRGVRVEAPAPGPADEAVVRDVLSAVVTARADRVVRGKVAALASPDLRVRIMRRSQPAIDIARGAPVPASGQIWLGLDGRAVLVPGWVGAALDRDLASLRIRRVFPPVAMTGVEIHETGGVDVVLSGSPLRRRDEGSSVRVARALISDLAEALAAVSIDLFVTGDTSNSVLSVRVLGGSSPHELFVHGPCPGHETHSLVSGSAGTGCVRNEVIARLEAAAAALASDVVLETSLVPTGAAEVDSISDGSTTLTRRGAGWMLTLDDERFDADDDAVNLFFEDLATIGEVKAVPAGEPTATWKVTLTGGSIETWRWFVRGTETLVRRDDEAQALVVPARTADARRRFGAPLRNLSLLVIDAATINAITATGANPASLTRGQLVGEWVPAATPAVATIVEMLATFRGRQWLEPRELGAIRRTLTFSIDAPPIPGEPATTHTIAIGAARPAGRCAARVDAHLPIELDAAQCAALLAPLTQSPQ